MGWLILAALGGLMQGSFALPMKFTTRWRWENTWSAWSLWTLLVLPWLIGTLTIPNLIDAYRQAGSHAVLTPMFFGAIWGVSAIAVGKGLDYLGLGLGFSLIMGLVIAVGSILPLLLEHPADAFQAQGLGIIIGVFFIIVGIVFSAWSAALKERDLVSASGSGPARQKRSFLTGLIICLIAGVTAPMLNYAFIYGDSLRVTAEKMGASQTMAPNAVWAIALLGGFVVNFGYCLLLLRKNNSWRLYASTGTGMYYLYTLIMGILWAGGIAVYGMATANLGKLGPSVGWAICFGMAIFSANVLGLVTREWAGVKKRTIHVMIMGLAVILAGICLVGWSNGLRSRD
jgi:L-rhamnose-H+ transport protein